MFDTVPCCFILLLCGFAFGQFHQTTYLGSDYYTPNFVNPNGQDLRFPALDNTQQSYFGNPLHNFGQPFQQPFDHAFFGIDDVNFANGRSQTTSRIPNSKSLFTPSVTNVPAATSGQIEAYNKALQEEAEEAQKEAERSNSSETTTEIADLVKKVLSYVSVRLGGDKNVNYQYSV